MTVSKKLVVKGGKPDTRSKLYHDRSPALIEQFLQEAETDPGVIEYRFLPIWEVLKIHFGTDNDNFNRALILTGAILHRLPGFRLRDPGEEQADAEEV